MYFYLLFIFVTMLATAEPVKLDSNYPRDNAICQINGRRLEVLIRGDEKNVDPNEIGFGQYVLYSKDGQFFHLPLSKPHLFTYRFMPGDNSVCSKARGFFIDKQTLAILFQKQNGSSNHKLVIQLFDTVTLTPKEAIETEYISDEAIPLKGGFAFVTHPVKEDIESGSLIINGESFQYQDRKFSIWYSFDSNGFSLHPHLTYSHFPWKSFFRNEDDFLKETGWDKKRKLFTNQLIYYAVNHKLKKECLLILKNHQKLTGAEAWRCH